jgi:GrpB-like predicted nucleotidyltransferase (UPF0157 family)
VFEEIRAGLANALAEVPVVAIEHVGSTSVPGLAAKPIIDVDVVVSRQHVDAAIAALVAVGYTPLGEMGVIDRHGVRAPVGAPRQNVYVTVDGCLSLRNHLGLRAILRGDQQLRDEYAAVKRQMAAATTDIDVYIDGKSAVVQRILAVAGLTDTELDEIAAINRL